MDAIPGPQTFQKSTGPRRASVLLEELLAAFPEEKVTLGELLERLEGRAFGLILLLLSLPMCIPNIPGISTVFAVAMFVPAWQMTIGRQEVWLPQRARDWSFSREAMGKGVAASLPFLRRIERLARPRYCFLLRPPFMFFWGLMTLVMAFVLLLPIPGGNWPVGVTVATLALAMLQEDGVMAIVSLVFGAITLVTIYLIIRYGPRLLVEIGQVMDHWVSTVLP
jgi:hypothetical protein